LIFQFLAVLSDESNLGELDHLRADINGMSDAGSLCREKRIFAATQTKVRFGSILLKSPSIAGMKNFWPCGRVLDAPTWGTSSSVAQRNAASAKWIYRGNSSRLKISMSF
jgi:hypothetical protein